jgi:hypothetical protein
MRFQYGLGVLLLWGKLDDLQKKKQQTNKTKQTRVIQLKDAV